jgi:hypothetical protein
MYGQVHVRGHRWRWNLVEVSPSPAGHSMRIPTQWDPSLFITGLDVDLPVSHNPNIPKHFVVVYTTLVRYS